MRLIEEPFENTLNCKMAKTTIFDYWSSDIKFPDKLRVKIEDSKIKFVGGRDVKPSQWMLFIGVFKGIKYHNKLYAPGSFNIYLGKTN